MEPLHRAALAEIGAVMDRVDDKDLERLCRAIADAQKIVVYGCGREALQIKGFAMRLYHLGLNVAVVGDMTAPPVGAGDLFLATSGPGETSTVLALLGEAKRGGARTFVLTAEAKGSAARQADEVLLIPAQTMASDRGPAKTSVLPMGSVYRGRALRAFRGRGAEAPRHAQRDAGGDARPPHQSGIAARATSRRRRSCP